MNYTIQDYQNVLAIYKNEYKWEDGVAFQDFIENTIAELSKPVPKMYRCIEEIPGYLWAIGTEATEQAKVHGIPVSKLPFHFELIPEPVKLGPITMQEICDGLNNTLKCVQSGWVTASFNEVDDLIRRIKSDHNL